MNMSTASTRPCVCGGIDVHAHVIPANFPAYLGAIVPPDWPSMAPAHECHRHVMIAGKVYRTVADKAWDMSRRIEDLGPMGLDLQVISPMPELLSYWMKPADAAQLLRYINETMATMVADSGGKLAALGAVPLQDIGLALAELDYCVDKLGFAGIEVGSNINGKPIGDPAFFPFFEAAEAKGAAIFVHALKPAGMDRLVGPAQQLRPALAYPTDVGLAAASCLTSNLIERFPRLRIAFSHGGGTLAMLLPRLEQARRVFAPLKELITASPSEQARKLYYDSLVFDAPTLRHLVDRFGATQLMIGTDYPFAFHDRRPVQSIADGGFDDHTRDLLVHDNARRFLGIEPLT
jgi:aminocarboxymuconate-semialdehyde decarboxylase